MTGYEYTPPALDACPACRSKTVTPEGVSILADYCLWDTETDCYECAACGACCCGGGDQ